MSVVIPTIGRDSLTRAVESALKQNACTVEVVVVLDEPDAVDRVKRMLECYETELLITPNVGSSAARNRGLFSAHGKYVAFLDDDDAWYPAKLQRQLEELEALPENVVSFAVTSLEFIATNGKVRDQHPQKFMNRPTSFPAFLLSRRKLFYGGTYFQTSSLLARTDLLRSVTWDESLLIHTDWDIFIRLVVEKEATVIYVDEPLTKVYQGSKKSVSASGNWERSLAFLRKHDLRIRGRARADFLLVHVVQHAVITRSRHGIIKAIQASGVAVPHIAAMIRFLGGVILNGKCRGHQRRR